MLRAFRLQPAHERITQRRLLLLWQASIPPVANGHVDERLQAPEFDVLLGGGRESLQAEEPAVRRLAQLLERCVGLRPQRRRGDRVEG